MPNDMDKLFFSFSGIYFYRKIIKIKRTKFINTNYFTNPNRPYNIEPANGAKTSPTPIAELIIPIYFNLSFSKIRQVKDKIAVCVMQIPIP